RLSVRPAGHSGQRRRHDFCFQNAQPNALIHSDPFTLIDSLQPNGYQRSAFVKPSHLPACTLAAQIPPNRVVLHKNEAPRPNLRLLIPNTRPWKAAVHARVEVSPWRTHAYEEVAAGRIDMALSAEEAPPALVSEVLFNLDFVCLVGSAQPIRSRRLTLKQYLELPHALVETLDGRQTLVDRPLAQLGVKRTVALSLPFFVPAMFAI